MNTSLFRLCSGFLGLTLAGINPGLHAEVTLPPIISSHMVIQRNHGALWGKAKPGEAVSVTLEGKTISTKAGKDGNWRVKFATLKSGGPHSVLVKGENTITLDDVVIGDVWVCGGQSQMEAPMSTEKDAALSAEDVDLPNLRAFLVEKCAAGTPQEEVRGEWIICSPSRVGRFSALGFYFGGRIVTALKMPIGLVQVAVGGTPAEAWAPQSALSSAPALSGISSRWAAEAPEVAQRLSEYQTALTEWQRKADEAISAGKIPPAKPADPTALDQRKQPSGLYNGMIAPLAKYPIAGVIWFQGEANVPRPAEYQALFPAVIRGWRMAWGQGDFPFYFTQLPGMYSRRDLPEDSRVAELREAQAAALSLQNTGMVSAIDLGEERVLQLKSKSVLGKRLAQLALARDYGATKKTEYPVFASMKITGNKVKITFKNTGGALMAKTGTNVRGFAISGSDRRFAWATAEIQGDTILLSSPVIDRPVAARYAWADFPDASIYGKSELPLLPFRTDSWERTSAKALPTPVPAKEPEAQPSPSPSAELQPEATPAPPAQQEPAVPEQSPSASPAPSATESPAQ